MNAAAVKPIAVVTHVGRGDPGLVGTVGAERGLEFEVYRPYDGQDLPHPNEIRAIVVLGGPQSAYDDHAYLATEERYLADAVVDGEMCFVSGLLPKTRQFGAGEAECDLAAARLRTAARTARYSPRLPPRLDLAMIDGAPVDIVRN